MSKIKEIKSQTIINASNSYDLKGVEKSYARILLPSKQEIDICNLISVEIISYTKKKNPEAPDYFDLSELHNCLSIDNIPKCSNHVSEVLRESLFDWALKHCQERLGFIGEFFLDEKIYLRINPPYAQRDKGTSSQYTHKEHRLSKYNNYLPSAFWAHGPHKDSWYGHSLNSINFWLAINDLYEDNTMVLYPEQAYKPTKYNSNTMYASYSEWLGPPVAFSLSKGENLVFDPELLHSTRLNTSNQTRVVLTLRACKDEPYFAKSINHIAYDSWISSSSLNNGDYSAKKRGVFQEIIDTPQTADSDLSSKEKSKNLSIYLSFNEAEISENLEFAKSLEKDTIYMLNFKDASRLCLIKHDGEINIFSKRCPHLGAPLDKAFYDKEKDSIICPAHGASLGLHNSSIKNDLCIHRKVFNL